MTKISTLLIALFSAFMLNAQIEQENCLLWEISGNGLEAPSYLYGTIHLVPKSDFFFFDNWLEKLETCDVLVLETDINLSIKEQLALIPKMQLPDGKSLSDFMTKDEFNEFSTYLNDSLEVSSKIYSLCMSYKPFFSYSLLLHDALPGKKIVYEDYLSKKAKKNDMGIIGLEELYFQLDLVDEISIEDQLKLFLFDSKKEKQTNLLEEFNKLLDFYKNQDLNSIASLESETEEDDYFYENFLIKRNIDWIGKIKAILVKKSAFIAVGAAHLPGEQGLINLLEEEGYTLKPVFGK